VAVTRRSLATEGETAVITVRYWAAARAAAGRAEDAADGGRPVPALVGELGERHGEPLARVLARCSFLLDGEQLRRDTDRLLPEDGVLDVLPPFAGG
jgi:molybdopterin converting factor small subunit